MSSAVPWVSRRFDFQEALALAPQTLERLRGTPARLESRLSHLPAAILAASHGGKWSVQEHAGHLLLTEALFQGRLDEYDAGSPELRPAEMSNSRVGEADLNNRALADILAGFRRERGKLVGRLEDLPPGGLERSAWHGRLAVQMRVCDMMLFMAEHDDHHMARITETLRDCDRDGRHSPRGG